MWPPQVVIVWLMERLNSEQIRLLEELRGLRDAGILTIEEFDSEVAKVLGRSQDVADSVFENESETPEESGDVVGHPEEVSRPNATDAPEVVLAQEGSSGVELPAYQSDDAETAEEPNNSLAESQVDEPTTSKDVPETVASGLDAPQGGPRRKILLGGGAVGLVVIATLTVLALVGGDEEVEVATRSGVEASAPSTQTTLRATDVVPTSEVATSTTVETTTAPTTTYEVLQCPYERTLEAVDNLVVFQEGVTISVTPGPLLHRWSKERNGFEFIAARSDGRTGALIEQGSVIAIDNETNFRLWISMDGAVVTDSETYFFTIPKWVGPTAGYVDSVWTPGRYLTLEEEPSQVGRYELLRVTLKFACP